MNYSDIKRGTKVQWATSNGAATATVVAVGSTYGRSVTLESADGVLDTITDTKWTRIEETTGRWSPAN